MFIFYDFHSGPQKILNKKQIFKAFKKGGWITHVMPLSVGKVFVSCFSASKKIVTDQKVHYFKKRRLYFLEIEGIVIISDIGRSL